MKIHHAIAPTLLPVLPRKLAPAPSTNTTAATVVLTAAKSATTTAGVLAGAVPAVDRWGGKAGQAYRSTGTLPGSTPPRVSNTSNSTGSSTDLDKPYVPGTLIDITV